MKSRAIVLHITRYNDEQLIVNLLTEQAGCIDMMVRISRSKRATIRHSLFQPLALLDVEWDDRSRRNLQRPKSVQVAVNFVSLPYDPLKNCIALFLAETLYHAVRNEPDAGLIYKYIEQSVEWLDTCERDFANFHLVFLLRLTHFLGFMPNVEEAHAGYYFDLRTACFVPQQPPHPDFLVPNDAALVPKLLRMRYDSMRFFKFSGKDRSRLLEYINIYYRLHLPNFPELNSLAVLKEMFAQ